MAKPLFLSPFLFFVCSLAFAQSNVSELDYLKHTKIYQEASAGDANSAYQLALIYYYGDGKSYIYSREDGKNIPVRDLRQAFIYFDLAQKNGNTDALYHFGLLNLREPDGDFRLRDLGADRQKGLRAIEKAAQQAHSLAQYEMSKLAEDIDDIIYWEEKAAQGGHIPSQYNMNMRLFQEDNPEEQAQALEWFFDFIYQNTGKFGIYSIGHIATAYLRGKGKLSKDPIKAYAYQSLFVKYYPSCQDSESFRQSLLREYYSEGELSESDIPKALSLAREIEREIESRTDSTLKDPAKACR